MLDIHQLHYRWPGTAGFQVALPELHLTQGQSLFVHGPSGSGKSTLLNLIGGVLVPQSGEIRLLGQAFSSLSSRQRDAFRADHIGFIFQQFNLIPYLSVLDNVLLPCRFSCLRASRAKAMGNVRQVAEQLLEAVDISPALHGRQAACLSVGQQQRVAAARALLGAPELIIADEPTSALDSARQANFMQLLHSESQRCQSSIVFVSHDLGLAAQFDQILSLSS